MTLCPGRGGLVCACWLLLAPLALGQGFYGNPRDKNAKAADQMPSTELPAPNPLKLPAVADEIVVGGSGKFLIAHLNALQKLAIIDVAEMKMIKLLSAPADEVLFAANADKLFVILVEQSVIQRWSLDTFEREIAVPLPQGITAGTLTTGFAATDGLLLVGPKGENHSGRMHFLDPKTLQERQLKPAEGRHQAFECNQRAIVRASANGKLFSCTRSGVSPAGYYSMLVQGDTYEVYYEHDDPGLLNPSADGERLYSAEGVFGPKLKKVGNLERMDMGSVYLPSITGEFYERVSYKQRSWNEDGTGGQVAIFMAGDTRPLVSYRTNIPAMQARNIPTKLKLDRRLMLFPEAKKLVVLDKSEEVLNFFDVDPLKILEESDRKYLFVSSRPPQTAEPGKALNYQVAYRAKSPKVTIELVSGPDKMTVTPAGKLTWTPPAGAAGYSDVILMLKDDGGQETFHNFRLVVGGNSSKPYLDPVANSPTANGKAGKQITVAPDDLKLTPSKFSGESTQIKLPGSIEKFELAGGGRYLLAHLKGLRKLVVVDLCEAKIAGFIPVDDDSVLFAGSAGHIVTVLNDKQIVIRWSLPELKRELAVPLSTRIKGLALGSASAGPLVMLAEGDRFARGPGTDSLYDLTTLQPLPLTQEAQVQASNMREGQHVRVAADGSLIVISGSFAPVIFAIDGKRIRANATGISPGGERATWGIPNADGSTIYAHGRRFSSLMRPLDQGRGDQLNPLWLIPSAHDRFYLSTPAPSHHRIDNKGRQAVAVYLEGESRPLANLPPELNLLPGGNSDNVNQLAYTYDKRIAFVPNAQIIVSLDAAQEALVLTRFDLEASLEASGLDYLYVTSRPPKLLDPGQKFVYQLAVKSKRGGVKSRLESGPPGMTLDAAGKLTWTVPDDAAKSAAPAAELPEGVVRKAMPGDDRPGRPAARPREPEQTVVLAISDQSGQEIFHTFTVAIRLPEPPPKPVEVPKPQFEVATKAGAGEEAPPVEMNIPRKTALQPKPRSPVVVTPFEQPVTQRSPFADRVGETHTWTDADSGRTVEAKLLGVGDGNVRVALADGRELPIPLARLSRSDLIWLLESVKSSPKPAVREALKEAATP